MISYNKELIERDGIIYDLKEVHRNLLYKLPEWLKAFDYIDDKQERIVKKTALILSIVSHSQPFDNANKRTVLSFTRQYLIRNGFYLPVNTSQAKREIYNLLFRAMMASKDKNLRVIDEIEDYLCEKIT